MESTISHLQEERIRNKQKYKIKYFSQKVKITKKLVNRYF